MTWDTAATYVAGETGDKRLASAQLGHADGAGVAVRHYLDPQGYMRVVVDNPEVLEDLRPAEVAVKLNSEVP
ncbi:MAG: hypothetical protein JWN03_4222 [Nocardia sp.]|uniref:hypothetical protein n=1 Tax=Nocardia sp. TaxID=1821 RepID=UPI002635EA21|nr:hypothetical protein [Nocardia sp.]MCU1643947.1 hypothetical protein [Nocardia sp.]